MKDPALAIHDAFLKTLREDVAVQALVGDRIYAGVPQGATKPYITLGHPSLLPNRADCIDGVSTTFPVHGWAKGPGIGTVRQLGDAIVGALDEKEESIVVAGFKLVVCELEQTNYLEDPDPETLHVVVLMRVETEPTA